MHRPHPFRLYRRTVGKSCKWYAVYDDDPAHPRSTGVDASKRGSYDRAIAAAYARRPGGGRGATLRSLTEDMFTEDCLYRQRMIAKRRGRPYGSSYWTSHRGRLKNYIWPRFGDMQPERITAPMIDDWLLELDNTKGIAASPELQNKVIQTARIVLREMQYRDLVSRNVAMQVGWFDETARRQPFTLVECRKLFPEDMDELVRIWLSLEWATYFYLLHSCGLRPGEAAAFRLADWKPGEGAAIHQAVDPETREIRGLKTSNKGLVVKPIILNERLEGYLTMLKYQGHDPEELLFTMTGQPLIPDVSQKHFKGAAARAGVDLAGRTQYSLRHTFATETLKVADKSLVERLLGHRKLRAEYDHREALDWLEDNQGLRDILNELF